MIPFFTFTPSSPVAPLPDLVKQRQWTRPSGEEGVWGLLRSHQVRVGPAR